MPATLHINEGPDAGRLFSLVTDQITIGRNADNTIVLNDTAVSGLHTKIVRDEQGRFTVHDQASTNGTFLNGKEQRIAALEHGDELRIGSTTMTFELFEGARIRGGASSDEGVVPVAQESASLLVLPPIDLTVVTREDLERTYRRALLLERLDRTLAEVDGPTDILTAALDASLAGAGGERGLVLLIDGESGEMVPSVVRNVPSCADEDEVRFSKSLAFDVWAGGQSYRGDSPTAPAANGQAARQVVVVPVRTTSTKGGVLYVEGPPGVGFGESAQRVVEAIARRAGTCLSATRWRADFELLFSSMVDAIMNTIQAKDVYTRGHSERVRHYSKLLARELGIRGNELYRVTLGAGLHDIGKVGMPDSVLKHNVQPILTPDQMEEVKKHPARGARILGDIPFLKDVIPAAELHHEDWDGGGYPHGLKGEEIPLIARIVAVADTYDAITTDRPYQKGKSYEEGHAILRKIAGKRLEPDLVELFIQAWHKYRKGPARGQQPAPEPPVKPAASGAGDPPLDVDDKLSQVIQIG